MKRLLVLFSLVSLILGCSNENTGKGIKILNSKINQEMGTEVYIPQFEGLEVSLAYISYDTFGDPSSIVIQYSQNPGNILLEFIEHPNVKALYGPYDTDAIVIFSFDKKDKSIENVSGERIKVNGTEIVIQDSVDSHNFQTQMFMHEDNKYVIGYKLDALTEEEALRRTEEVISNLLN